MPTLELDLTLNLVQVGECNIQVFSISKEEPFLSLPGQPVQCLTTLTFFSSIFNLNINHYNSCPFLLYLSEKPGSTFSAHSLSIHLMCSIPFTILVAILWTCSTMPPFFMYWGLQTGHVSPDEVSQVPVLGKQSLERLEIT